MQNVYRLMALTAMSAALSSPVSPLHAADANKAIADTLYHPTNGPGKQIIVSVKDDDGIAEWWIYDILNPDANGGQGKYWDRLLHRTYKCDSTTEDSAKLDKKFKTHSGLQIQLIDCDDNDYAWKANNITTTSTPATPTTWHDDDEEDEDDSMTVLTDDLNNDLIPDLVLIRKDGDGATLNVMTGLGDGNYRQPRVEEGSILRVPNKLRRIDD